MERASRRRADRGRRARAHRRVPGRLRESLAKSRRALTNADNATFDPGSELAWSGWRRRSSERRRRRRRRPSSSAASRLAATPPARGSARGRGRRMFGGPPSLAHRRPSVILRRRRQRHREDDNDRQARPEAAGARTVGPRRRRGHLPRGGGGAAGDLGAAGRGGLRRLTAWSRPRCGRVRRGRGGAGARGTTSRSSTPRAGCTQANLMAELEKVRGVIETRVEGAPHETLLVVDATTGQNGLQRRGSSARRSASPASR